MSTPDLRPADLGNCKHEDSLWGRCASCGRTWEQQAEDRAKGPVVRHTDPSPHAGMQVVIDIGRGPEPFRVEDWWDRVYGKSWMYSNGNPAAMAYAVRSGVAGLPVDDEVLYGKDSQRSGHLVHVSEVRA